MKDSSWQGSTVCPKTYHGTRMNKRALDFHTQLHDWSDAQRLTSIVKTHPRIMPARTNTEVYLPVKRQALIENWTKDVNKYYHPDRGPRVRSGSFMVIDVSKFNMKTDKNDQSRVKSAMYPSHSKARIVSAVSTATTGAHRRFFGTDVHTVNNKLIDTQMHYSAQRRNLYSASSKKSPTTEKNLDITNEESILDLQQDLESETFSNHNTSINTSDQSEDASPPLRKEILQPQITARSWSNKMLNVISIDDCKLTCRYRPQTIKEAYREPNSLGRLDTHASKAATISAKQVKEENVVLADAGDEADDEGETSEDIVQVAESKMNGIQISNGLDTNNNGEDIGNTQHTEHRPNLTNDISEDGKTTGNENPATMNGESSTRSSSTSSGEQNKKAKVYFKSEKDSSRAQSNGTSYGRLTNLYSNSIVTSNTIERKGKKQSRTYKLNRAITDMVAGRRVMNSMERDFDTRTSQFGRTVVEKSDGSQMFQKVHANLRKKMDSFLDTHSAIKTQQFYEQRSKNSSRSSTPQNTAVVSP